MCLPAMHDKPFWFVGDGVAERLSPQWQALLVRSAADNRPAPAKPVKPGEEDTWLLDIGAQQRRYRWEALDQNGAGRRWRDRRVADLGAPQRRACLWWSSRLPEEREGLRSHLWERFHTASRRGIQAAQACAASLSVALATRLLAPGFLTAGPPGAAVSACVVGTSLIAVGVAAQQGRTLTRISTLAHADWKLSQFLLEEGDKHPLVPSSTFATYYHQPGLSYTPQDHRSHFIDYHESPWGEHVLFTTPQRRQMKENYPCIPHPRGALSRRADT